jgi:hypothetical protein
MRSPKPPHAPNLWNIPELRADRLGTVLPTCIYVHGAITEPSGTLFVWRTAALSKARGCTLAFYRWDTFFEALWRRPKFYTALFRRHALTAVIEPDFSLWADDALAVQVFNVYRTRWLGRYWQEAGLTVIPSLNWGAECSFTFCFQGIPQEAPVVAVECRTAAHSEADRTSFLAGLAEGVRQVQPQRVLIYGGQAHAAWLTPHLPAGPRYMLLKSWSMARNRCRRQERLHKHSSERR